MPIVEVTCSSRIDEERLARLTELLPHAVSLAVECPEEPYDHDLQPGDVEIRFRSTGPHDVSRLDVLVEVRSKWFESRARDRQERCERLCDAITDVLDTTSVGVYLTLPVAAWAQVDPTADDV
jgi:hypothetical protein